MPQGPAGDGALTASLDDPDTATSSNTTAAQTQPPDPPDQAPAFTLELACDEATAARVLRHGALTSRRTGRLRSTAVTAVWHDTASRELAAAGLALAERSGRWRLERLAVALDDDRWHPGAPPAVLAEADEPAALVAPQGGGLPGPLAPVAAFRGRSRSLPLADGLFVTLEDGTLRGVTTERAACRLILSGPLEAVAAVAQALMSDLPLALPPGSLAAEALALADGATLRPRHLGTPEVPPGTDVAAALRLVAAHLADVILHWAALAPSGASPEPVHQMRVAVRRLRSALTVFNRVAGGPLFARLQGELRELAARLGEARDWDVFLDGTGAEIQHAFAAERRVAALLAAAARRRVAAYAALGETLGSPVFRRLALELALLSVLEPWRRPDDPAQAEALAEPARRYASRVLARRLKRVTAPGDSLDGLTPEELHAIRKQGKRLRYTAEFFAPLYSGRQLRRFLQRLEVLQEELGLLNDSHTAGSLMAQLGAGPDRAFASGVVQGFLAARAADAETRVGEAWRRFYRADPYWD